MRYDFSNDAKKAITKFDSNTAGRIVKAIMGLPDRGDIKTLDGELTGQFRLRVGDWRVIYSLQDGVVIVNYILPRGDAYK
jgi:mRNA interferase RelE/StbE